MHELEGIEEQFPELRTPDSPTQKPTSGSRITRHAGSSMPPAAPTSTARILVLPAAWLLQAS
jgi:hypothetical protein